MEHHINGLINRFAEVLIKDPESPHKKFLMIMQRLKHKYEKYVNGDLDEIKPLSLQPGNSAQTGPSSTSSSMVAGQPSQRQPDQGLHILSEAAGMGGPQQQQQQQQQQNQGPVGQQQPHPQWYQPVDTDVTALMTHPLTAQQLAYQNAGGQIPQAYEAYDYVTNRMGYDMDMRGLIGGEGLWGIPDPFTGMNGYQMPF